MPRPARPRRRALRAAAALCTLIALPAVAPAAASADYASANEWAGGAVAPDRQSGHSRSPAKGVLVSMTTSPTRARLSVILRGPRCQTEDIPMRGRVTPGAGGDAEHLAISVEASLKVRDKVQHLDYAVSLQTAVPGVLTGTASVRGTYRDGGRTKRCDIASPVVLRSRASLDSPLAPSSTDRALPRVGVVSSVVSPRVKGAIAITKRADGQYHGLWTGHVSCRSGRRRSSYDAIYVKSAFHIRADGTFYSRVRYGNRGTVRGRRFSYKFSGTLRGRIDGDGIARGTVASTERYKETGYLVRNCRLPESSFAAAP